MNGKRLKELRIEKNLTQTELAKILGVDVSAIGKWEIYDVMPNPTTFNNLCDVLNVTADYLLGRDEKNELQKPNYYPEDLHLADDEYLMIGSDGKKEKRKMTPELKAYIEFLDKRDNKK